MKKNLVVLITAVLIAFSISLNNSVEAAGSTAPNGLYQFGSKQEYIPLTNFLSKNLKEKTKVLTGNYYLILGEDVYKTLDIVTSSNRDLPSKKMTVSQLERNMNVKIDSNGNISPISEAEKKFEVLSIY